MARIHQVALPHLPVHPAVSSCAYTQKVRRFAKMMELHSDYDVTTYGGSGSLVRYGEFVSCYSLPSVEAYGHGTTYPIVWDPDDPMWKRSNAAVISELEDRVRDNDVIALIGGQCQKQIADAFPDNVVVEHGIGYEGVFSQFRAFESYAWMHYIYGRMNQGDGRYYDAVIPNFYDIDEFELPTEDRRGDYLLYVGRVIRRKGLEIAIRVAEEAEMRLVIAGQITPESSEFIHGHGEFVGVVGQERKVELMYHARALIAPTIYIEPFGGVAVEAQLCGTPVIASDFGAFTETVADQVSGFRFRTIGEATWAAVKGVDQLANGRDEICRGAIARWSLARVAQQFSAWFDQILDLRHGQDFYTGSHTGVSKLQRYAS